MTSSQNWTYKLLQGWLWALPSSRISTWHSRCAGEQCFYAIPDVLSLERIDPSSDVGSCLAVGVCSVRKKLRKVKQRCHVVSESQSHVVLLFGRDVSSGSLFGYEHNLPTVKVFLGCEQARYVAWPAQYVRSQCVEDFLMRHNMYENRGALEQGAQHHGQSCADL